MTQIGPTQPTPVRDRLKQMTAIHKERMPTYGNIGSRIINELYEIFEEFISKELDEIMEMITLLESLGDELDEEKVEFHHLNNKYTTTETKLSKHISELKEKLLGPDWALGLEAWGIVTDVNTLRKKVDRWTKREIQEYDRILDTIDSELKKRGIKGPEDL